MLWQLVAEFHALNHLPAPRICQAVSRDHEVPHGENRTLTTVHIPPLRLIPSSFIPIRSSSVSSIATASDACTRPQVIAGNGHIEDDCVNHVTRY